MRWHIGIFSKRKALFFGLAFLALLCVFVMFHDVQGEDGRQPLSVMTYNVGTLHGTKVAFREIVNAVEEGGTPDLLLLQEIPEVRGQRSVVGGQGRKGQWSGGRVNGC